MVDIIILEMAVFIYSRRRMQETLKKKRNDNELRALTDLRIKRNNLLAETDFYALSDVTMSNDDETYRRTSRHNKWFRHLEKCNAVTWPTKPYE